MRVGIYVGLRLVSEEKLLEWTFIRPIVFYLTYSTDVCVVIGILVFLITSAPLKPEYVKPDEPGDQAGSPATAINEADSPQKRDGDEEDATSEGSAIDGDQMLI